MVTYYHCFLLSQTDNWEVAADGGLGVTVGSNSMLAVGVAETVKASVASDQQGQVVFLYLLLHYHAYLHIASISYPLVQ